MNDNSFLFFDVDTQVDFIEPDGALYVPAAETLKPKFKQLIRFARLHEIPVWGSVDAHTDDDSELIRNKGPFPDHCMQNSNGQKKIPETDPHDPVWINNRHYTDTELSIIKKHVDELYFEKQSYNMFDNPNLEKLAKIFSTVVVFGVATDYCVLAAVIGFRKMNKTVIVVEDAIKPVSIEGEQKALKEMQASGAIFVKTDTIVNGQLDI